MGSDGEWQEPVLAILKLWGVARTSSCHLKTCRHRLKELVIWSGKNRFLPLGLARTGSCHFKNCINSEHRLYWEVMGSGRNWFLPLWEWQELVLAIFKWCQHRLEHQGMGVASTMGMVTITITIAITITITIWHNLRMAITSFWHLKMARTGSCHSP